jgi:hypothetical protein
MQDVMKLNKEQKRRLLEERSRLFERMENIIEQRKRIIADLEVRSRLPTGAAYSLQEGLPTVYVIYVLGMGCICAHAFMCCNYPVLLGLLASLFARAVCE